MYCTGIVLISDSIVILSFDKHHDCITSSVCSRTHCVCVFFVYRRPTLILSNVWEIFQHFQKLGKAANIACPFDV